MKKSFLLFLICMLGLTGGFDAITGFAQSDPCIFYNEFMMGVRPRSIKSNSMAFIEKLRGIAPATIDKLREAVEEADASGSPLQRRFELERVVKSDAERFMIRIFFNLNDYESCPEMLDSEQTP